MNPFEVNTAGITDATSTPTAAHDVAGATKEERNRPKRAWRKSRANPRNRGRNGAPFARY